MMQQRTRLKSEIAYDRVLGWIQTGRFGPGEKLPSEQELAGRLSMNHLTVRRALAKLCEAGLIEKRPKVGTFVAEDVPATPVVVAVPRWVMGDGGSLNPYYARILNSMYAAFDQNAYDVSTLSYRPGEFWEDVGRIALSRGIRGMILSASGDVRPEVVGRLIEAGIQIVLISVRPELDRFKLPTIQVDSTRMLDRMVRHLIELGHRDLVVAEYSLNPVRGAHQQVIREACRDGGIDSKDVIISLDNPATGIDFAGLEQIFERKTLPTATVVTDEYMAGALFRLCYQHRVDVPGQMSIASVFDSLPDQHPVPLSAPDTAGLAIELGREAAQQLALMMRGGQAPRAMTRLASDIQWKASVAGPSSDGNKKKRKKPSGPRSTAASV